MNRRAFVQTISLAFIATPALAQGRGAGGAGRRGGGAGRGPATSQSGPPAPPPRAKAADQVEIVGVVKAVDPETQRITIAYEAADELGLPAGTMPFPVSESEIVKSVTVGEKVRFKLESHQIYTLTPY